MFPNQTDQNNNRGNFQQQGRGDIQQGRGNYQQGRGDSQQARGRGFNRGRGNRARGGGVQGRGEDRRRNDGSRPLGQKMCNFFQQGICNKQNCTFLHAFTKENDLQLGIRHQAASQINSAVVINEEQIAIALDNIGIQVLNVYTGVPILSFNIQGQVIKLFYTPKVVVSGQPQNFNYLLYGGTNIQNAQLLGGINTSIGSPVEFPIAHLGPISDITEAKGLIFTSSHDCQVGVWYHDGQQYLSGLLIRPDENFTSNCYLTSVRVIGDHLVASTSTGYVIGWSYDFFTNKSSFSGSLEPVHNGLITCLLTHNDQYLLSGSLDGRVIIWDANKNFTGYELANTGKQMTAVESMLFLANTKQEMTFLIGEASGRVQLFKFDASNNIRFQNSIKLHRSRVIALCEYTNTANNILGFLAASQEQGLAILGWV